MINRIGSTHFGPWLIEQVAAPFQRWLYQVSGGSLLRLDARSQSILILTTMGRRSGKPRATPVFFLNDGKRIIICNAKHGSEKTTPWVLNLRANPSAVVQIGAKAVHCQAHEAGTAEIEHYWLRLIKLWPAYQEHYARSGKQSIFLLEPIPDANH